MIDDSKFFPGLYLAADAASLEAQTKFFNTLKVNIALLIVASGLELVNPSTWWIATLQALLFLGTLFLSLLLTFRRFDFVWYNGRALAESIKTLTWRFVMRASPFEGSTNDATVQQKFVDDMQKVLQQNQKLGEWLNQRSAHRDAISQEMLNIRSLEILERKQFYLEERVTEQGTWYHNKAITNKDSAAFWFTALCLSQGAALVFCLVKIKFPECSFSPSGVLAVLAGGILSWTQARRFQELSSSYALAAYEIGLIKAGANTANSDETLSEFIVNSEMAFSREHTQWQARKS